jgi:acyl carrier protein
MAEAISSRTPEGEPNLCPVCGGRISIEPSLPSGDAPCPQCGTLLWFTGTPDSLLFYELELVDRVKERLYEVLAKNWGIDIEQIDEFMKLVDESRDSLGLVELIMELEEDFQTRIADESSEIQTVADLIEWLLRRGWGRA